MISKESQFCQAEFGTTTIFIELNIFSVFALISAGTQGKKKRVQGRGLLAYKW
jgi:hypothetical protein